MLKASLNPTRFLSVVWFFRLDVLPSPQALVPLVAEWHEYCLCCVVSMCQALVSLNGQTPELGSHETAIQLTFANSQDAVTRRAQSNQPRPEAIWCREMCAMHYTSVLYRDRISSPMRSLRFPSR